MSKSNEIQSYFPKSQFLNIKGKLHDFSTSKIMGILNITPDSFYSNSRIQTEDILLERAHEMIQSGADILDIGANSTRPGAKVQSANQEIDRLGPYLELLKKNFPSILLSLDTYYGAVAQFGIDQGVDMINDISAGQFDPILWSVVAKNKVPYILSYNRASQNNVATSYLDQKRIISDALIFLSSKKDELLALGCKDLIIDPGFGFGKSVEENHELLQKIEHLHLLGSPIMVGLSRKSMIHKVLQCSAEEALNGTSILNTLAHSKGSRIFRVHDVRQMKELIQLLEYQDLQ
jgi:dihydropteroate synthase